MIPLASAYAMNAKGQIPGMFDFTYLQNDKCYSNLLRIELGDIQVRGHWRCWWSSRPAPALERWWRLWSWWIRGGVPDVGPCWCGEGAGSPLAQEAGLVQRGVQMLVEHWIWGGGMRELPWRRESCGGAIAIGGEYEGVDQGRGGIGERGPSLEVGDQELQHNGRCSWTGIARKRNEGRWNVTVSWVPLLDPGGHGGPLKSQSPLISWEEEEEDVCWGRGGGECRRCGKSEEKLEKKLIGKR